MLIVVNDGKIVGYNLEIGQEGVQFANCRWAEGLTIEDMPGFGDTLDYFVNAAGEISSKPKEVILPAPSEMEVLTAKVDYVSMVVEGLVMANV